jgi:Calreticulin family
MWVNVLVVLATSALLASKAQAANSDFFFLETFAQGDGVFSSGRWVKSKDPKYTDQPLLVKTPKKTVEGFEDDKGLVLSQEMKHYGLSSKFPTPLDVKGKDLVIQYELKLEDTLACGGAYVKLPRATDGLNLELLNNDTPYTIMFGPDKCGSTNNKVSC